MATRGGDSERRLMRQRLHPRIVLLEYINHEAIEFIGGAPRLTCGRGVHAHTGRNDRIRPTRPSFDTVFAKSVAS